MRRRTLAIALSCALAASLAGGTAVAPAKTIEPYEYTGTSFTGEDTSAGTFEAVLTVAVDEATGNVYVVDGGHDGTLNRFDASGAAQPFSDPSLAGASSITLGEGVPDVSNLEVDNSGTASQGNVYVMVKKGSSIDTIFGFAPSGVKLPGNWHLCGLICSQSEMFPRGIAVDAAGTLWVSEFPGFGGEPHALYPLDSTGAPSAGVPAITLGAKVVTLSDKTLQAHQCCKAGSGAQEPNKIAFDSQGNAYAVAEAVRGCRCMPGVMKFDGEGNLLNEAVTSAVPEIFFSVSPDGGMTVDRSTDNLLVDFGDRVVVYDPTGKQVDSFGGGELDDSLGVAVNSTSGRAYATTRQGGTSAVRAYEQGPEVTVPDVETGPATEIEPGKATLTATIDPDGGGDTTQCFFEFGLNSPEKPGLDTTVPCDQGQVLESGAGPQQVTATAPDLGCSQFFPGFGCVDIFFGRPPTKGFKYFYRVVTKNAAGPQQGGEIKSFRNGLKPGVGLPDVTKVGADSGTIEVNVDPEGGDTTYRIEYGTSPAYGSTVERRLTSPFDVQPDTAEDVKTFLGGLQPDTTYHYKVVADNQFGSVETADRTFQTFPKPAVVGAGCPNLLARQQTGAAHLLDCRAYELVSASDTAGSNVESDLAPEQRPFAGFPETNDRVLYAVQDGGIPGTGNPTNRGEDPYVATRNAGGWSTKYVGIPSFAPSENPFSSSLLGADDGLSAFAFGGEDFCDPCFADGTAGIPLRLPDGQLVQGMAGALPVADPTPAGLVAKPLSGDGSHLVFGSEEPFEPEGNSGAVTIYDRDLKAGTTQIVSRLPNGEAMSEDAAALDVSRDGSRILIAQAMGAPDAAGNQAWSLYLHLDGKGTTALNPGAAAGALYAGMSEDGSSVYFTTSDALDEDTDSSPDLYRADVDGEGVLDLVRVSTGSGGAGDTDACNPAANGNGNNWNAVGGSSPNHCGAVAFAGGGGVAAGGAAYFLSPEQLDGGGGTPNQPNLYLAEPGSALRYVATLDPDDAAVKNAVKDSELRRTADFQVNPTGTAVFATAVSLSGFENRGHAQVHRYHPGSESLDCVSCAPTNSPATGPASLASNGLSVTDDGRVFFNSPDRLSLFDSNNKRDAYEWTAGKVALISTGIDADDSSLLSVSADGTSALFFTRMQQVAADLNGRIVKIYDARANGGFFTIPPQPPCAASDECHGPGTVAAPPPPIRTVTGTAGQVRRDRSARKRRCRRGFVKRRGRCVRRKKARCPRVSGKRGSAERRRTARRRARCLSKRAKRRARAKRNAIKRSNANRTRGSR